MELQTSKSETSENLQQKIELESITTFFNYPQISSTASTTTTNVSDYIDITNLGSFFNRQADIISQPTDLSINERTATKKLVNDSASNHSPMVPSSVYQKTTKYDSLSKGNLWSIFNDLNLLNNETDYDEEQDDVFGLSSEEAVNSFVTIHPTIQALTPQVEHQLDSRLTKQHNVDLPVGQAKSVKTRLYARIRDITAPNVIDQTPQSHKWDTQTYKNKQSYNSSINSLKDRSLTATNRSWHDSGQRKALQNGWQQVNSNVASDGLHGSRTVVGIPEHQQRKPEGKHFGSESQQQWVTSRLEKHPTNKQKIELGRYQSQTTEPESREKYPSKFASRRRPDGEENDRTTIEDTNEDWRNAPANHFQIQAEGN